MMRRRNTYTICFAFGLSVVLIIAGIQYADNTYYYLTSVESRRNIKIILKVEDGDDIFTQQIPIVLYDGTHRSTDMKNMPLVTSKNDSHGSPHMHEYCKNIPTIPQNDTHSTTEIETILEKARSDIKYQFNNYNFSQSGVRVLEDLVMESAGTPLRTLIISTWRSGSTFLGELINAVPGTYYYYEPLLMYGDKQMRRLEKAGEALSEIKSMFKCDYEGLEDYFDFGRKDLNQFSHSTRLWDYCNSTGNKNDLCYDSEFTSRLCKLFPFQSMKLVRLRLQLVEEILDDKELNVKVILLIRDPRGVMQSRQHCHFCELSPDCWAPSLVCADMISDYVAAGQILQQYPDRLMVIRFEELALNLNITTQRILKFLKLDRTQALDEFLQSHTHVEVDDVFSTFKISQNVPFKWKTALGFNYVQELQMACRGAMHLWGYKMAHNETHMTSKEFNPIEDFTISS